MTIEPMKRDVRKLKMGDTFFIECRFVSADRHAVSVLIGNDYGHPIRLRANMGELAYLYEEKQELRKEQE
jgi:hypothetical protein